MTRAARLGVLVLLVLSAFALPAPERAQAYPTSTVELTGHGYGHGRGMGQWGAYGYASDHGWSHQRILDHFYSNTNRGTQPNSSNTVRLLYQDNRDLVVTSQRDFRVDDVLVAGGSAARIELRSDGQFTITPMYGCAGSDATPRVRKSSKVVSTVANPGNDQNAFLAVCTSGGTNQYRGTLALVDSGGSERTVNTLPMEDYLRSVVPKESPASWADSGGAAALRAQAVAARSYAYSENRYSYAKTCDTTSCQVYAGAGRNRVSQEDYRTDAAIRDTANEVIRFSSGAIARAEFSSSTGGYSAGGDFPAVRDEGDVASPYHDWDDTVAVSSIEAAYGVGTLQRVQVVQRNGLGTDGGRVLTVHITGTARTVEVSGNDFRTQFGLLSDWFSIVTPTFDGPGFFLRDSNSSGPADTVFAYGRRGDVTLTCDWNGDGLDTPGVFRAGVFHLRNSNTAGAADLSFSYGVRTDLPVCGDWDGDGVDTVGVFRNGVFHLRNTNTGGVADLSASYGLGTDLPIVGDWNADGYDTIGVLRNGTWYLSDSNRTPATRYRFNYGTRGDRPLAGDWTDAGRDGVGVHRGATFYLKFQLGGGGSNLVFRYGSGGDRGLAGNWDGRGPDTVGIARGY